MARASRTGYRLALASLLAAACGIASAQELVFNTQDFSPFSYLENKEVAGPGADIIKAVCKEAGLAYAFKLLPWTRAQDEVKTGKAHALFLIGWNDERAAWLDQSPPLLDTEYGFFVAASDSLKFSEPKQLSDYSVAVYGPSNTQTTLEKLKPSIPGMSIDVSPTDDAAFLKLEKGMAKAVFSNRDVGQALIKKLGLKNVRYAGKQSSLKYYIGFSKQAVPKASLEAFNAAYRRLYKAGRIHDIVKPYGLSVSAIE